LTAIKLLTRPSGHVREEHLLCECEWSTESFPRLIYPSSVGPVHLLYKLNVTSFHRFLSLNLPYTRTGIFKHSSRQSTLVSKIRELELKVLNIPFEGCDNCL